MFIVKVFFQVITVFTLINVVIFKSVANNFKHRLILITLGHKGYKSSKNATLTKF